MEVRLRLTETHHTALRAHLLPGDGLEAVAIALCGRRRDEDRHVLTVRQVVLIPYEECKERAPDRVTWSTARLVPMLEEAAKRDLAILKVHSHPGGYARFSSLDDSADSELFASVFNWTDSVWPQASAVMLPDGSMFGRAVMADGTFHPFNSIMVPGNDIRIWSSEFHDPIDGFAHRHAQLFGAGTTQRLRQMSVAIVGCSGTGSPLVEQLARLGCGRLVLVDPDHVEEKNLNRILNATREDANQERPKVEVMKRSVDAMGLGTIVEALPVDLATADAVRAVASCDVVFGCMDGVEGRHLLNRLAAFYLLPYFDLGVRLDADGHGGIDEACAAVHYLMPDGATLLARGVYTMGALKSAGLRRTDPDAYREQVNVGYIRGVAENRPAVISINMQTASIAVNEFLARLHPFRLDDNADSAAVRISFIQPALYRQPVPAKPGIFSRDIGKGDVVPLLSMPELSDAVVP